jgi:magnesium transporter
LEAETIEDHVWQLRGDSDKRVFLRRIGTNRRNVMSLMRLLGGKADVLRGFTKRCNENYKVTPKMDIGLYLGDIQDHVVTMMNNLNHCEKILTRTHTTYLGHLQVESMLATAETNSRLGKMTFIASILVPLNIITGLFGMNVPVPFGWLEAGNLAPFFTIAACLAFFLATCFFMFRRRGWW